jgi:hypothetical protein
VPVRRAAGGILNASKICGQGDGNTMSVQHRPATRSQWIATVRSDSTTLGSRAATMPSDPTTPVSDMVRRQDVMASMPLKTSFASPSRQGPIEYGSNHLGATCQALGHSVSAVSSIYKRS